MRHPAVNNLREIAASGTVVVLVAVVAAALARGGVVVDERPSAVAASAVTLPIGSALNAELQAVTAGGDGYVAVSGSLRNGAGAVAPLGRPFLRLFRLAEDGSPEELPAPPVEPDEYPFSMAALDAGPCVGTTAGGAAYVACFAAGRWSELPFSGTLRTAVPVSLASVGNSLAAALYSTSSHSTRIATFSHGRWNVRGPAIPVPGTGAAPVLGRDVGTTSAGPIVSYSFDPGRVDAFKRRRIVRVDRERLVPLVPDATLRGGGAAGPIRLGGRVFLAHDVRRGAFGVNVWHGTQRRFVALPRLGTGDRQTWLSHVGNALYAGWQAVRNQGQPNPLIADVEAYVARLSPRTGAVTTVWRFSRRRGFYVARPTVVAAHRRLYGAVIEPTRPDGNETVVRIAPLESFPSVRVR